MPSTATSFLRPYFSGRFQQRVGPREIENEFMNFIFGGFYQIQYGEKNGGNKKKTDLNQNPATKKMDATQNWKSQFCP